jgi:methylmalonyl-CoA/ethylmalonyl-CoA epimerase
MHHVGYVVKDIEHSAGGFVQSLNATWDGKVFEDPNQKVKVTFLSTGDNQTQIELVEPNAPDAPVLKFLQEKGGGLHHVCYETDNLDHELAAMRAQGGIIAKRPKPAVAFEGRRIAWVMTAERLLVELLESA